MSINIILVFLIFIILGLLYFEYLNSRVNSSLLIILIIGFLILYNYKVNFFSWYDYKIYFTLLLLFIYLPIVGIDNKISTDKEFLMLMVLLGSIILVMSENLIIVYLALELQTFSLFILISGNRYSIKSNEGGLKYFILGAISSGLFLISLSIIYYSSNGLNISSLNSLCNEGYNYIWKYLLLLSMFFKLSLFPLHFWIPDIYEASSNNIMALVGSLPKISVLAFVIQLNIFSNFLMWCALGSIFIGTLGAINQSKIKRLIAYSGISHIGLGILTLSIFIKSGLEPSLLYIMIYIIGFMSLVLLLTSFDRKSFTYVYDLSGFSKINILIGLSWCLLLLSMGGLPPLSGFLIKWWVIWTMIINDYSYIGLFCIIMSAIGMVYYLRITKICYFQKSSSFKIWENAFSINKYGELNHIYLGLGFYLVCFLIFNPTPLVMIIDLSLLSYF